MSFFDDNFYKELDKDIDLPNEDDAFKNINDDKNTEESNTQEKEDLDHMNLEVNKKNKETFDDLMGNVSAQKDDYWDLNNPVIKIVLIVLFVIIIIGLIYYIVSWFNMN